jgi:hypothetical protein
MKGRHIGRPCLSVYLSSVHVTQLQNRWTDLDETGMDIMPLGSTLKSYFEFHAIGNTKIADKGTCKVRSTNNLTIYGYFFFFFWKIQNFVIAILWIM